MRLDECGPALFCAPQTDVPGCGTDACCSGFCDVDQGNMGVRQSGQVRIGDCARS
jgi:hypothetical protein